MFSNMTARIISISCRNYLSNFVRTYTAKSPTSVNTPPVPSCAKVQNMANKLRAKTPIGKLEELEAGKHPQLEKEPLKKWPNNTNPHTGEIGGPRGPEPTRYGDWERKGRVSDF